MRFKCYLVQILPHFSLSCMDDWVWVISDLAANGLIAYDQASKKRILVVPWVLCHLGDSPMHAEISNTPNPSQALNPCRICPLTVVTKAQKQTLQYVKLFLGLDANFTAVCFHI